MLLTAGSAGDARHVAPARRTRSHPFRTWRRQRPFVGGLLLVLSGIEIFASTQLDLGNIRVQMGIEGFQAVVIPAALVLLGALAALMPAHHVFYGVIALVVAVYSVIGVNLGGFFVGMLLGAIGGVLVVAWAPRTASRGRETVEPAPAEAEAVGAPVHAEYMLFDAASGESSGAAETAANAEPEPEPERELVGAGAHAEYVLFDDLRPPKREGQGS